MEPFYTDKSIWEPSKPSDSAVSIIPPLQPEPKRSVQTDPDKKLAAQKYGRFESHFFTQPETHSSRKNMRKTPRLAFLQEFREQLTEFLVLSLNRISDCHNVPTAAVQNAIKLNLKHVQHKPMGFEQEVCSSMAQFYGRVLEGLDGVGSEIAQESLVGLVSDSLLGKYIS